MTDRLHVCVVVLDCGWCIIVMGGTMMDVTVLAQQVSAVVLAAYGLVKAVIGLIDLIRRRKSA